MPDLGHILHSEPHQGNLKLLRRIHDCLSPEGVLVISEMVADQERKSAVFPLLFDLNMLVHTESGKAYTAGELEMMCKEAGFSMVEWLNVPAPSPLLIATR